MVVKLCSLNMYIYICLLNRDWHVQEKKIHVFLRKKNVCLNYSIQFAGTQPVITGGKLVGNRKH